MSFKTSLHPRNADMPVLAKAICVIGAGPSGLAALRAISERPEYLSGVWTAVAFEARESLGGVWYVYRSTTLHSHLTKAIVQAARTADREPPSITHLRLSRHQPPPSDHVLFLVPLSSFNTSLPSCCHSP